MNCPPQPDNPDTTITNVKCNVAQYVGKWINSKFQDYLNQVSEALTESLDEARGIELILSVIPIAGAVANYLIESYRATVAQGVSITSTQSGN